MSISPGWTEVNDHNLIKNLQMNKSNTKRIVFLDETCKTKNRINKKRGRNCARRELRKQLQNDDLLKNYFVIDTEKDETTVFRINNNESSANNQIEITKHVSSHPKISINDQQPSFPLQNLPIELHSPPPNIQLSETIRNDEEPLPALALENNQHQQHPLNLFILQLCCALIEQNLNQ